MRKERKLLRKQMELLAEQSNGATGRELAELSVAMCDIYDKLVDPALAFSIALLLFVLSNFIVSILILVKYLFWC